MPSAEFITVNSKELNEKCGLRATYTPGIDSVNTTLEGISNLQHRGQDAAGLIAIGTSGEYSGRSGLGLVPQVFPKDSIDSIKGDISLGHTRYGTSHVKGKSHAQPILNGGVVALAHNGNLPETTALDEFMIANKIPDKGYNDSEKMQAVVNSMVKKGATISEAVLGASSLFTGAWSLGMIDTKSRTLVAARDPWGMRPLTMGRKSEGVAFASESRALKDCCELREIKPGEIAVFDGHKLITIQQDAKEARFDIFEILYLMKPDSVIFGQKVEDIRRNLGRELGREMQDVPDLNLDMIVPTPDTAIPYAQGLAENLDIPLGQGLIKNPGSQRTFIASDVTQRTMMVEEKLIADPTVLDGKIVGLTDDTVVRGTTTGVTVRKLRDAGAQEVHLLIPSSPIQHPDFYGVNTPNQKELIANRFGTPEELAEFLGADSIHYLSINGMVRATKMPKETFSFSAFNGEYPIPLGSRENDVVKVKPLRLHSTPMQFTGTKL